MRSKPSPVVLWPTQQWAAGQVCPAKRIRYFGFRHGDGEAFASKRKALEIVLRPALWERGWVCRCQRHVQFARPDSG